ncbi:uncharacterized protein LAJ45_05401 [Morchella importuna]|uniref:uncharacterized protein n=1 Tax=Morchella importuna TaxID=1174673 RepID=UPI001E8D8DB9|nr:uncharacterized protein LAJ45_05401 [Morchella importuna]KAH8150705.1 hypothetical protein LAJ45_05401 [Morchella importuna]
MGCIDRLPSSFGNILGKYISVLLPLKFPARTSSRVREDALILTRQEEKCFELDTFDGDDGDVMVMVAQHLFLFLWTSFNDEMDGWLNSGTFDQSGHLEPFISTRCHPLIF